MGCLRSRSPLSTYQRHRSSAWWASRRWWAWSRVSCSHLHLLGGCPQAWGAGGEVGAGCRLWAGDGQASAGGRSAGRSSSYRTQASRYAPQSHCTRTFSGSRGSVGRSGASWVDSALVHPAPGSLAWSCGRQMWVTEQLPRQEEHWPDQRSPRQRTSALLLRV